MLRKDLLTRRKIMLAASMAPAAALALASSGPAPAPQARGKAAIITGASRGIGAAIASRLASDGFAVVVNYHGRASQAEEVVRSLRAAGGRAIPVQADVAEARSVARLFDAATTEFGGVDVVVSNAGVMRLAPFRDMTDSDFDTMATVNFKGGFNVLREAARRVRDHGRIVALSSGITQLRTATYGPYAATKVAQDVMVSALAKELAGRMISVNAVAPGTVNTTLFTDGKTAQQIAAFAERTPHKRLGEPGDIANVVSFLCGPDGAWINGQTLHANGGLV